MSETKYPPLLIPERVKRVKKIESKKCVFDSLTELLAKGQSEVTKNEIFDALISREKLGNTYIGKGIAVPRAHINIINPRAALLILKKGLDLNSPDKIDINVFLGLLIPDNNHDEYCLMLSTLNKALVKDKDIDKVIESSNKDMIAYYFEKLLIPGNN